MAKIRLEVGKTYETRDGQRVTITDRETEFGGTYRFFGLDAAGRMTWRIAKGRFDRHPSRNDLVREIG